MGKHREEIRKIEKKSDRQITYSKRRSGLLKKAFEISTLCDTEVALLAFSPSGRPSIFGGKKRIDAVLQHYINLPQHQGRLQDREALQRLVDQMQLQRNMHYHQTIEAEALVNAELEDISKEMETLGNQLDEIGLSLKYFEDIPIHIKTVKEMELYEEILRRTMDGVQKRKQELEGNLSGSASGGV